MGLREGWLDQFVTTISALVDNGEVVLSTFAETLPAVPIAGLAYLPTASYREMEGWALPPLAAQRLINLETELGEERLSGPERAAPGLALAQLPRQVRRGQPDAQEDAGAIPALPRSRRSVGSPRRHWTGSVQRRLLARRLRRTVSPSPA